MTATIINILPLDPGHMRPRDGWAASQATIRDLERDNFARMMKIPRSGEQASTANPEPVCRGEDPPSAPSLVSRDGSVTAVGARALASANVTRATETGAQLRQSTRPVESETLGRVPALGLPLPTPVRPSTVPTNVIAGMSASGHAPERDLDPAALHVAIVDGRAEIAVRANASEAALGARLAAVLDDMGIHPGVIKVNGIVNGKSEKGVSDGN